MQAFQKGERNFLLVAHTPLTVRYLTRYMDTLDDRQTNWTITSQPDRFSAGIEEAIAHTGLPYIPLREAVQQPWAAAFFAAHYPDPRFSPFTPKILIQHGLGAGKSTGGQDYSYGPLTTLDEHGKPRYDLMLEASHSVRAAALRANPALEGRIEVVGDPFCDDVLRANGSRAEHRERLDVPHDQRLVFMSSTWGPDGLMGAYGAWVINQLQTMPADHHVVMTMHPHLWQSDSQRQTWPERVQALHHPRVRLLTPADSWVGAISAADAGVIDHSSQGLFWSLVGRPTVAAPVRPGVMNQGTLLEDLRDGSDKLWFGEPLWSTIDRALSHPDHASVSHIAAQVTSYPLSSADRVRFAVHDLIAGAREHDFTALARAL